VADSFDAMTTERPYQPAMSVQQAALVLWQRRGRQWDASVVEAFLRTIAEQLPSELLLTLSPQLRSSEEIGPLEATA
jgi:HD-GYP domain-containing protein (c-di-GMP phosphodiesterase class II)